MIVRVFDIETTGIDASEHKVIEIAAYDLYPDGRIEAVGAHLVNPGRNIPPEASAVHHLIESDLTAAQSFQNVWPLFIANAPTIFAAHNCAFEQDYLLPPQGTTWICTHKCALRAWADAPGHSNQTLRYWLKLDSRAGFDRQLASASHRAGPDAYVTAWLLKELRASHADDALLSWTKEPKVFPKLTFGKHRGSKWQDVPTDYIQWLRDGQHSMDNDWRFGAKIELERRAETK